MSKRKGKRVPLKTVDRFVHRDIEQSISDEVSRQISLAAIALFTEVYGGPRTDKEYAVCLCPPSGDVWCFVECVNAGHWKVLMLPPKEAEEYLAKWDDEDVLPDWQGVVNIHFRAGDKA